MLPLSVQAVGTGPGPFFWFRDEARIHWVSGDVAADSLELGIVATPMVVGFLLPERLFGAMKDLIAEASGDAL